MENRLKWLEYVLPVSIHRLPRSLMMTGVRLGWKGKLRAVKQKQYRFVIIRTIEPIHVGRWRLLDLCLSYCCNQWLDFKWHGSKSFNLPLDPKFLNSSWTCLIMLLIYIFFSITTNTFTTTNTLWLVVTILFHCVNVGLWQIEPMYTRHDVLCYLWLTNYILH